MALTLQSLQTQLPDWQLRQRQMMSVVRWGKTVGYDQCLLEHVYSIQLTGDLVYATMVELVACDWLLYYRSLREHDVGEALLQRDIVVVSKTAKDDVAEANAYRQHVFQTQPEAMAKINHRAFLLQFCLDPPEKLAHFSAEDQEIMRELAVEHPTVARLHQITEILDYLMSGLVGHEQSATTFGDPMLVEILGNVSPRMDAYVIADPRLQPLWTAGFRRQLHVHANQHGLNDLRRAAQ